MGGHFDIDSKKVELEDLNKKLSDPNIYNNVEEFTKLNISLSTLNSIIEKYDYLDMNINTNLEMLLLDKDNIDEDIYNDINNSYEGLNEDLSSLEINTLLDGEFDSYNCYLEIHPGAGGTEAMDWASMLLRMYQMYFDKQGYKYEIVDYQDGDEAGIKSVMLHIIKPYAYGYLKSEIGVHRLVRISPFNAAGKRQTSFAAVNVTPEIEDVPKDIEVKEEDIRWDITRASGNGGQGVNTTDSAVRLTHLPTGIVVYQQTERSQLRNKEKAFEIMKTRLYDLQQREKKANEDSLRNSQIGTGDRSEKIRTYNYPQNRVTDHRINFSVMNLEKVMNGDLDPIIEELITEDTKRKLQAEQEG